MTFTVSKKNEEPESETTGVQLLCEILSWARPHNSECEKQFCKNYLDPIEGMQQDAFGNRYLRIGDAPVLWSCHVDTVGSVGGLQPLTYDKDTSMIGLGKQAKTRCLGADDGAGVWIMMEMIRAKRPGLYVFHRGEEVGCLGSKWISDNSRALLDGIKAAMAFDRMNYEDVITHQAHGRTCSEKFAQSFADQLNKLDEDFRYEPSSHGVFTDTNEYAGFIDECSNLSVGYFSQHSSSEVLNLDHVTKLKDAMLQFDTTQLVYDRDAATCDEGWGGYGNYSYSSSWTKKKDLYSLVYAHAASTCRLLKDLGVTEEDLLEYIEGDKKPKSTALTVVSNGKEQDDIPNALYCCECGKGWMLDDPKDNDQCPVCRDFNTIAYCSDGASASDPDEWIAAANDEDEYEDPEEDEITEVDGGELLLNQPAADEDLVDLTKRMDRQAWGDELMDD